MTQHTAKTFIPFVLEALYTLTKGQAFTTVHHKEVVPAVMALAGIADVNEYGWQGGDKKKPFVSRRIGWAFADLRKRTPALCHLPKRGRWALTNDGVDEVLRLRGDGDGVDPDLTLAIDPALVSAPAAAPAARIPTAGRPEPVVIPEIPVKEPFAPAGASAEASPAPVVTAGVHIEPKPAAPVERPKGPTPTAPLAIGELGTGVAMPTATHAATYHADPYIVALATQQTPCFGAYSPRSSQCGTCPLSGSCVNALRARLARMAVNYRAELNAPAAPAAPEVDPVAEAEPSHTQFTKLARKPEWDEHDKVSARISNSAETECYRCGETIPVGVKAMWARVPGGGTYHIDCK